MAIYVILPAGGVGKRFGADKPKQFLELAGAPIIIRTIQRLISFGYIDRFIIAMHPDWHDHFNNLLNEFAIPTESFSIVDGGKERANSIENAIAAISHPQDDDIVVIHDAIRPFVEKQVVWECIEAAREFGAANAGVPAADTMLFSERGEFVESVPERSYLFNGQTPDVIRLKEFIRAIEILTEDQKMINMGTVGITMNAKIPVKIVRSNATNIKITTPEELILAEAIAQHLDSNSAVNGKGQ
jgi:2-C-methyl-D-erythritol 4-phosphate cytidylyltransferase